MYTEAKEIISLDVCRDEKSLGVTFLDSNHARHTMIFRIDNHAAESSDGFRVYKSAVIESLITEDRKNPITCITSAKTVVRKTPISWEKAAEVLATLKPLAAHFVSDSKWVFESMEQVVSSEQRAVKFSAAGIDGSA